MNGKPTRPILISMLALGFVVAGLTQASERTKVPISPEKINPLPISDLIPDVAVKNAQGADATLAQVFGTKPTILVFYRGSWCPYCKEQLTQLTRIEPKLTALGYQIVAISPDRPEKIRESSVEEDHDYTFLSDSEMKVGRAMGVAYRLTDKQVLELKTRDMDLAEASGRTHHMLPVPSVFIVNTDSMILDEYIVADREKLDTEALLAAAESASK